MPFKKIVASDDVDYMMGKILHSKKPYSGYNAKTYKWCDDMIKEGVIDSARTTSAAIKYSTGQAAVVISAKCVVSPPNHIRLEPNDMGVQRAKQVGLD